MAAPDNVLTKFHDLLLYLLPQLAKFPRDQKFLLADRIQVRIMDAQECCLRAYYARDKGAHLRDANMALEIARHLVRLAHGMKFLSTRGYGGISERIDEVGRMIGGWLKNATQRSAGGPAQ